jgi:hypothetical protein
VYPTEKLGTTQHDIVLTLLDLGATGFTTDNMCLDGCMYLRFSSATGLPSP